MRPGMETSGPLYKQALDSFEGAVLIADEKGVISYVNRSFSEWFRDCKDVIGKDRKKIISLQARSFANPPVFSDLVSSLYDRPFDASKMALEMKTGQHLHLHTRPVRDPAGKISGRIETYTFDEASPAFAACDITVRHLPISILTVDDSFRVISYNPQGARFIDEYLGFVPDEFASLEVLGKDHPLMKLIISTLTDGSSRKLTDVKFPGRKDAYFDLFATPVGSDGRSGTIITIIDETDRHMAEAQPRSELKLAEFFIDLMGHDISNFNQISMGYMEMLGLSESLTEEERAYLQKAMKGVEGSNRLIENVRIYRHIRENGDLNIKTVDLSQTLRDYIDQLLKAHADQQVVINLNAGQRHQVMANQYLHYVIRHIVDNAIKYDRHPEILIDIDVVEPEETYSRFVTIRIADRGPGIPPDRRKIVFERIGVTTRGAGIGLSIVSLIMSKLGGRIWIEDRVPGQTDQGSVFVFQLRKA